MRVLLIALLAAISYAQTEGFCVERSGCLDSVCSNAAEAAYCPCTCNPGTINSNADHFSETFGTADGGSNTAGDASETADQGATDNSGSGSGGDVTTDVAPPSTPVTFTVFRRGYVCEEQDFELAHFPLFPLTSIQQCAELVAKKPFCSPVFWVGLSTQSCGCVKQGYECALNEGNDQQADSNVYMLSPGSAPAPMAGGMGALMPGILPVMPGMGGMPGAMPGAGNMFKPSGAHHPLHPALHPGGAMFANEKFEAPEAPEAEDLLPGYFAHMMAQQGQQSGPVLSKTSPQAEAKGTSPLVWVLCFVIPTFVGFFIGAAMFRKYSSSSELRERITV